ncbi:hypothetical protein [Nocardia thailandica]
MQQILGTAGPDGNAGNSNSSFFDARQEAAFGHPSCSNTRKSAVSAHNPDVSPE